MDAGFWSAMLGSRTFWLPRDHGALLGTLVLLLVLMGLLVRLTRRSARRRPLAALHADASGSTTMLDLVLVTPLFVFFMVLVFQFAILAKNHLFTHYAAYAAARSARVYFCPKFPLSVGEFVDRKLSVQACDDASAEAKADIAARVALIPAAPYKALRCQSGCAIPEQALKSVAEATGVSSRWGAIQRQARYMFDKPNVKVSVRKAPTAYFAVLRRSPQVPVVATVEVRFLLLDYARWIFADGKRKDGLTFSVSRAEVSLL